MHQRERGSQAMVELARKMENSSILEREWNSNQMRLSETFRPSEQGNISRRKASKSPLLFLYVELNQG